MGSSIVEINILSFSLAVFKREDDFVSFITQSCPGDAVLTGEFLSSIVRTQQTCTELAFVGCRLADFLGHSCNLLTMKTNSLLGEWSRTAVNKWKKVISALQWLDSIIVESYQANNWTIASVYLGSHQHFREDFHRESLFYRALNRLKAILKEKNSNPYSINYRYQEALACL
jgi:hypothetical protein